METAKNREIGFLQWSETGILFSFTDSHKGRPADSQQKLDSMFSGGFFFFLCLYLLERNMKLGRLEGREDLGRVEG